MAGSSSSGSILENLSGRKLAVIVGIVLLVQALSFLLGGIIAPAPSNADQVLGTICAQDIPTVPGDFSWKWAIPRGSRGPTNCKVLDNLAQAQDKDPNITANHVVFAFQLPLPKERRTLDYSRWQQNLIGVLHLDVIADSSTQLSKDPVVTMDVKMGYRNKDESSDTWHLLANSTETRTLKCDLNSTTTSHPYGQVIPGHNCDVMSLFELGSLHHDFYLVNVKFPINREMTMNRHLGQLTDAWLVVIHQNGGFTKVWLSLKSFFLPMIVGTLWWYWRRITILERPPHLLEACILALGIAMCAIDLPVEFLTLSFNMPYMLLFCDIRQGIFYAMLLSFWLIFCGEHTMDDVERNRLSAYWKHLSAVFIGCLGLLIFDICERGVHLLNPFYSIWSTELGRDLAVGFIALSFLSAFCYFAYLLILIYRVRNNIACKRSALPSMSQTRRLFYEGIIYRFQFLLLATILTAGLTIAGHFVSQLSEGQWKFDDDMSLEFTSAFLTGVLGCWNGYVFMLLILYAPSHKYKRTGHNNDGVADLHTLTEENQDSIEFSRLTNSESCTEPPETSGIASLADFAKKVALD